MINLATFNDGESLESIRTKLNTNFVPKIQNKFQEIDTAIENMEAGDTNWGQIGGDIENQTDLQAILDSKIGEAPTDSKAYARKNEAWEEISGGGDMLKSVYDTNDNGIVDNSEALGGQVGTHYLARANHTGTQLMNTISNAGSLATLNSIDTAQIANQAVTNTKLENMNTNTVKGRLSGNGTPQDIAMDDLPIGTATQTALNGKEDTFTKNTAFNKNFGTTADTVAQGNTTVNLTGDQTIAGVKTFSASPIVPTPTTGTQVANKDYVDANAGGANANVVVFSSPTPFSAGANISYTITHNLGLSWFDIYSGRYSIYLTGNTSNVNGIRISERYLNNKEHFLDNAWLSTPSNDAQKVHWQANTLSFRHAWITISEARVHIIKNY